MKHSRFGYSAVSDFENCPYKYQLRHVDNLKTLPNYEANNALTIGTAFHLGMEKGLEAAIDWYKNQFPVLGDLHENEIMKLEFLIPKVRETLSPDAIHETVMIDDDFIGTIDYLEPVSDGVYDAIDFKYCAMKNIPRYWESPQLHLYKYHFEKCTGNKIRNLGYLCVPKVGIKQKKNEDLFSFRKRIMTELHRSEPQLVQVEYDQAKVDQFNRTVEEIKETKEFPQNPNPLCRWCDYEGYCQKGDNTMILPSTERRDIEKVTRRKIWIYGASFSGKTTMLDDAPNPLNLNTDGNIQFVTMPYIPIKDEVTVEGRITRRKFAWQAFKDAIEELEKKQNDFQTIIVDLLEDTREMCRLFKYDEMGIQHESDSGYGKGWDIIKTEYLSTMRRFFNLDYENLIVVSHESISEVKKKNGQTITKISPNIQEAIANKIAGMVDVVARVVVEDDGNRTLNFKSNEYIFGGGRLKNVGETTIPLEWEALTDVYDVAAKPKTSEKRSTPKTEPEAVEAEVIEEAPKRKTRTRKPKVEETPEPETVEVEETEKVEEAPKRTRKRRVRKDEE